MTEPDPVRPELRQGLVASFHRDAVLIVMILTIVVLSTIEATLLVFVASGNLQADRLIGANAPLRDLFEFLYFIAGIAVALIAWLAISFARTQASEARKSREEAENSRLTAIYMAIVDRWNSTELLNARSKLFKLVDFYRSNRGTAQMVAFEDEAAYVADQLARLRGVDRQELRSHTILLQFFEDLGLLCWKGYIREADIFDFLGSSIEVQFGFFRIYIRSARTDANGDVARNRYANAIYLYKAALLSRAGKHEETMWDE
jgi:hypothetical protein